MHAKSFWRVLAALAIVPLCISLQQRPAVAQTPTVTLTITTDGSASGAVGVIGPNGNVCNPNPEGGGGGTCDFEYPPGTLLRLTANSPGTPGNFHHGTFDATACAKSTCEFKITQDSAITATFGGNPVASLTFDLLGDGKGNVGADNNQCQNFELGNSACTTFYVAGSKVTLEGRSMPGNIFERFSGGTGDAVICTSSYPTDTCTFPLTNNSSIDATFSKLESVAIEEPTAKTISVGGTAFFNARATFTNNSTRLSFNGNTPWRHHTPMDGARFSLEAAVVNDKLYAFGGVDGFCPPESSMCEFGPLNTVEVFNPLATLVSEFDQAWTSRKEMTTPRESFASAVLSGKIYAIGGHTTGGGAVDSMESYDPATNTWTGQAAMPGARARMTAAVIDNTIYVVGGRAPDGAGGETPPLKTLEAYDAATDAWITTPAPADMQVPRDLPAAAAVNGTLYVIGGDATGTVESYDPVANEWSTKATMPNGGGFHRAVALNGLIYAVGGNPITVKVYNPALNSWLALESQMPLPVSTEFALAVLDGRLFAAGGHDDDNTAVATLSANRPPEATWWSSNSAVGSVMFNSGSVQGVATGTATISARLVDIDSNPDGILTVTSGGGGGGSNIFLGIPSAASTTVGEPEWGCATFGQNAEGPWQVTIDYGDGFVVDDMPYSPPPAECGGGQGTKGWFFFNHAYSEPGTYTVTVTVRNETTDAFTTGSFPIVVQEGGGSGGRCAPVIFNIGTIGTVTLETVHAMLFDGLTNEFLGEGEFPIGIFDEFALPAGPFRIELSIPEPHTESYTITPSSFIINAVCDETVNLNATVLALPLIPPTLSVALSPDDLWPANNRLVDVTATLEASSPYGFPLTIELVSIASNEGTGDGDIAGAEIGTDDRAFQLRATRAGGSGDRTYTAVYRVTDTGTGLSVTASATALVPHDQRTVPGPPSP